MKTVTLRKETWAAAFKYGHKVSGGVFTVCASTIEAVIMSLIADSIRIGTLAILLAFTRNTEAIVTLLPSLAI